MVIRIENSLLKSFGVYAIKTRDHRYIYIGSSANKKGMGRRFCEHRCALRKNIHGNPILQNLYNKYGSDYFIVELLEHSSDPTAVQKLEEMYIKKFLNNCQPKCINLSMYTGKGSNWLTGKEKHYIAEAMKRRQDKITPIKQAIRNLHHKQTLTKMTVAAKKQWINSRVSTFKQTRTTHKSYRPIHLQITDLNKNVQSVSFQTEEEFFKRTRLETTTLVKLKQTQKHIIKRILPLTKHNYPVGTILELVK